MPAKCKPSEKPGWSKAPAGWLSNHVLHSCVPVRRTSTLAYARRRERVFGSLTLLSICLKTSMVSTVEIPRLSSFLPTLGLGPRTFRKLTLALSISPSGVGGEYVEVQGIYKYNRQFSSTCMGALQQGTYKLGYNFKYSKIGISPLPKPHQTRVGGGRFAGPATM